jgi:hypothetical protein
MCPGEINWSRAELPNIFFWRNNPMLNSENELVIDRRKPAAATCITIVHSTKSSEHRKVTNTLEQDELQETLL